VIVAGERDSRPQTWLRQGDVANGQKRSAPAWSGWIRQQLTSLMGSLHRVTDTVLPPACANCGRSGALLCANCTAALLPLGATGAPPCCARCARPTRRPLLTCATCRSWPPRFTHLRAAFAFTDPLPRIVHRLKYDGYHALGRPLGALMAAEWRPGHRPVDLVLPVPLHQERLRTRGYNQSALLARAMCEKMDWTMDVELLQRVKSTRPQVGLDAAARAPNVLGAFAAANASVSGRHLLLVDDICTTGATLLAAAQPLLDAGAATVSAYCLGRAA